MKLILLFHVVFYVVRAVHKFEIWLVIHGTGNKWTPMESDRCCDRCLCISEELSVSFCKVSEETGEPINIVKVDVLLVSHLQYI